MIFRDLTLMIMCALLILNVLLLRSLSIYLTEVTVFDMDRIRAKYEAGLKQQYMTGCFHGTHWPIEYRNLQGFNNFSSSNWCTDGREILDNNMYQHLSELRNER